METLTLTLLPPPPGRLGRGGRPVRERTAGAPSCRAGQELSRRPWRQLGAAQPLEGTKDPHWAARARLPSRPGAAERGRLRSAAGKGGGGGETGTGEGQGSPGTGEGQRLRGTVRFARHKVGSEETKPGRVCRGSSAVPRRVSVGWRRWAGGPFAPPPPSSPSEPQT